MTPEILHQRARPRPRQAMRRMNPRSDNPREPLPPLWNCPSCGWEVRSPFCPGCGERPLETGELTLRALVAQLARIFTNIDGRVIHSFRCLLHRPGLLTLAFLKGQRQPYLGPFQLFILANIVFFAAQSLSELRVFSTSLEVHILNQPGSEYARVMLQNRLAETGQSLAQYAPVYNQAVAMHAKSLIGLMVLPFALCIPLVVWCTSRPFAVHVVFSLNFFAFLLLLFSVPVVAAATEHALGGAWMMSNQADSILSLALLGGCGLYLFIAAGRVYETRGIVRTIQALLLTAAAVAVFIGYRFLLLPITLYTT